MTVQSRACETAEPLMRWQAVASIIRKDMHLLGLYALAGAIWMFAMSALFHTYTDFSALMASLGISGLGLDSYLFAVFGIGLAYLWPADVADVGAEVEVDIRGRRGAATVVRPPFVDRSPR